MKRGMLLTKRNILLLKEFEKSYAADRPKIFVEMSQNFMSAIKCLIPEIQFDRKDLRVRLIQRL